MHIYRSSKILRCSLQILHPRLFSFLHLVTVKILQFLYFICMKEQISTFYSINPNDRHSIFPSIRLFMCEHRLQCLLNMLKTHLFIFQTTIALSTSILAIPNHSQFFFKESKKHILLSFCSFSFNNQRARNSLLGKT